MNTNSRRLTALFGVAALVALFPIVAGAQDLGPYQITGGNITGANFGASGNVSGDGFTATFAGGPELLSTPFGNGYSGVVPLNVCFGCGLLGTDDGVGSLTITGLSDPALAGLVELPGLEGGPLETGELTVSPGIDVTAAGTYSSPFTLSLRAAYGPPGSTTAIQYVDITGSGTVTLDVSSYPNPSGPFITDSVTYSFAPPAAAPELDPGSAASGLTLLLGGLMVLRGRRKQPVAG
jgi:hypothetical protein